LLCYKSAINLHQQNKTNHMTNTTITHKTAFRVLYLHELSGMEPFEHLCPTIFETYDRALMISDLVCEIITCETIKVSVKYIVAVPVVGQVEVEHINYLP
jgi:hypothetical protein